MEEAKSVVDYSRILIQEREFWIGFFTFVILIGGIIWRMSSGFTRVTTILELSDKHNTEAHESILEKQADQSRHLTHLDREVAFLQGACTAKHPKDSIESEED